MSDADSHPEPTLREHSAFDPEGLPVYLGRLPADGSAQLRTLFCTALACGLAAATIPVRTRSFAEATVHSVSTAHPVVAPVTGTLRWSTDPAQFSGAAPRQDMALYAMQDGLDGRTVAVQAGERIAEVVGLEAKTLVVQGNPEVAGALLPGERVVVRLLNRASTSLVAQGRVSSVEASFDTAAERAVTVHIILDAPTRTLSRFESGQRVRVSFGSRHRSLWSVLSLGMSARSIDSPRADSALVGG